MSASGGFSKLILFGIRERKLVIATDKLPVGVRLTNQFSKNEKHLHACPVCGSSPNTKFGLGVVSPWVRELGVTKKKYSKMYQCPNCECVFFSLRYSDSGMHNLYAEYRSDAYTGIRKKWEGWYSESYNTQHSNGDWLEERAQTIRFFLSKYLSMEKSFVFDIGGDTGEISSRLGAGGFTVLELSNRFESDSLNTSSGGLTPIAVMAHVLEHVADPLSELECLLEQFEAVYVEVPNGLPTLSLARRSRAMLIIYLFLSSVPALWRKVSRPSTGRSNPASVLRLSEHLTFFSPLTIFALARKIHCEVTLRETEITSPGGDKSKVIQALFRRT